MTGVRKRSRNSRRSCIKQNSEGLSERKIAKKSWICWLTTKHNSSCSRCSRLEGQRGLPGSSRKNEKCTVVRRRSSRLVTSCRKWRRTQRCWHQYVAFRASQSLTYEDITGGPDQSGVSGPTPQMAGTVQNPTSGSQGHREACHHLPSQSATCYGYSF